jgi:hypothetical protein
MPDIDKAIAMAQKLRSLLIQVIAVEKERAEYEGSDEATDKEMEDVFSTFNEAVEADVSAVGLLAQIDQLLYDLMSYEGGGDGWFDADDVESKEVLKLKEIIEQDSQFHLKNILIPAAV